jgi:hypothetical protein
MASTIKARPNHYGLLGLTAGASNDDIARAYARSVGIFGSRPFADVAQASIAFETLRDPARRRAYDASLGISPPAQPRVIGLAGRARFIAVAAEPRPELPSEPRTASFIAASLRTEPQPEPLGPPQAEAQPSTAAAAVIDRLPERALALSLADADEAPVQWARPVAVAGGLVAAVIVLGAFIGWQAGNGEGAKAQPAVTAALPKAKPATAARAAAVEMPRVVETQPRRIARAIIPPVRSTRTAPAPQPVTAQTELSQPAAAGEARIADLENAVAAIDPAPVETAAAMPLSNATIARTIERIGYSCGQVASTAPAEGGVPGVYTVTCTSGQSYRAAPVRGRYRFRRVGKN